MSRVGAYAAKTDTGRKRRRNEDAFVLAPPLFAVADGMGGAQAGEIASKLAAAALEDTDAGRLTGPAKVASLIQEANRRVHERSSSDPTTSGMGTTMTVALVEDGGVVIGHVGDSRAYLVRGGQIEQITEDHSLVNELLKSGKLSSAEADTHPQRSVITRAVGTDPDVDVDSFIVEPQDGDVFLICSDGLTDMVTDDAILETVERYRGNLDRTTKQLVAAANKGGGEDNITVVAFSIGDRDGAAELGDTATMEAVSYPPDDKTTENVTVRATPAPGRRSRACGSCSRRSSCSRSSSRSSSGGCSADLEPSESRAGLPRRRRPDHRRRVRERLHRAQGRGLRRVAHVRGLLLRAVPRRALRRPLHCSERGPVPASGGRPAHRDRPDGDLPSRAVERVQAGALGRHRRGRVRRRLAVPPARLPGARELQVPLRPRCDRIAVHAAPARDRPDRERRAPVDPLRRLAVPARRAREGRAHRLPRRVPAREARGARPGPREGLGAAARHLGRRDARPVRHRRPRQRAPLLRDLPRDPVRGDRAR